MKKSIFKTSLLFMFMMALSLTALAVQVPHDVVNYLSNTLPAFTVPGQLPVDIQNVVASAPLLGMAFVLTPETLATLKNKYGEHLKTITVVVQEAVYDEAGNVVTPAEQYTFVARRPDRALIKMLLPLAKGDEIDEFADKAIKNLIVEGDMGALDDGIVYMGVVSQLQGLIQPAQSFLSNA
jgi:hypothetical protein